MQSHCYNMLSTCSRCHQGCTILHVRAHLKGQNSLSKTTKTSKKPWPEKANESRNEHNSAIIHHDMVILWQLSRRKIPLLIKKESQPSKSIHSMGFTEICKFNRLFKSKREDVQRN